jgi:hypothetical protein
MKRWIVAVVVGVPVVIVAVKALDVSARDAQPTREDERVDALVARIDSMQDELARVRNARSTLAPPATVELPPPQPKEVDARNVDPDEAAEARDSNDPFFKLEARVADEGRDSAWEAAVTGQARSAIGAADPGAHIDELRCGTTLCRVVVSHRSREDQDRIGTSLANEAPFKSGVVYDYDTSAEPPTTTMYVVREGQSFGGDPPPSPTAR